MSLRWKHTFTAFAAHLKLARGYSGHTLLAYRSDLEKLPAYLELRSWELAPEQIERFHLDDFIQYLAELGLAPRSQARLISALKTYFGYLLDENLILSDPTELLRAPKLGRKIPEVLTYPEIRDLLAQIDLSTDHGLRDRALLETLYACGLRVSEATSLKLTNLYLEQQFLRVTGKGDKERIVPIGGDAIKHLEIYLAY
ncbi:MAG: tyrosine-type recombinase/integrase, partial [Bacteroidota bacterium]